MKYFEYLKRILTFKKYPLFRTVPFKQVLLNVLIIGIILSVPSITHQQDTTAAMEKLNQVESQIPTFEIKNNTYYGENKTIDENGFLISFSNSEDIDTKVDISFQKNGIYISGFEDQVLPYSNFGEIENDEDLKEYANQQSKDKLFFMSVFISIQVFVLASFAFIILLVLSFIFDFISKRLNRKSDYMNWLKLESFAFVVASIVQLFVLIIFRETTFIVYVLTVPFLIYYFMKLPILKRKTV